LASTDELKRKLLSQLSIYEIIGETLELKERSGLRVGLCPFHDESSPSFTVYSDHFFCFGCRESGDAITFVRKIQGLGFIDALKFLAPKAGIDPAAFDGNRQSAQKKAEESRLYQIMIIAQEIFKNNLTSDLGRSTVTYLNNRGFNIESIKEFGFGYSLNEPTGLITELTKRNISLKEIEACSLGATSAKNGKLYDFYRNRLMIPIRDIYGRLIAFGGRALDDYPPKYKNSRDSILFDKSATLFGFDTAKDFVRKGSQAIVVEGYMDVLQLWQHGFKGSMACMGTALKTQHLKHISNITSHLTLLFDGDTAGQKASLSTVSAALQVPNLEIKVARLPDGEDPDSFVSRHGADELVKLVASAVPLLDFAITQKVQATSTMGIPRLLKAEIIPWLNQVQDKLILAMLINRISALTGIAKDLIEQEIRFSQRPQNPNETPHHPSTSASSENPAPPKSEEIKPLSRIELELIGHLYFCDPGMIDHDMVLDLFKNDLDLDAIWQNLALEFLETLALSGSPRNEEKAKFTSSTEPRVLKLFDYLERNIDAFTVPDRGTRIAKLISEISLKKQRDTISQLKKQLTGATIEDTTNILNAIKNINTSIIDIEKTL